MRLDSTLYRIALLSYPRPFRTRYGAEMAEAFECTGSRPGGGRWAHLLRACADAIGTGVAERWAARGYRRGRTRLRFPATGPVPYLRDLWQDMRLGAGILARNVGWVVFFMATIALWLGVNIAVLNAAHDRGAPTAAGFSLTEDEARRDAARSQELPGPVVDVTWLAERIGDPGLVVLHVGRRESYDQAHIPGARFLGLGDVSYSRGEMDDPDHVMLDLPADLTPVREALEAVGISDESVVVVTYEGNRVTSATRVLWTLEFMGLGDRSAVLDGGLAAWTASGMETTSDVPDAPSGRISARPELDKRVDKDWVLANLETAGVAIVDGRRPNSYTGEREEFPGRAGHIPGAGSLPIEALFGEDGRLLDRGAIRALFERAGVEEGDTVVAYCHIGLRATAVILAARVAGFDAVLYDGSMVEWAKDPAMPLERTGGGS